MRAMMMVALGAYLAGGVAALAAERESVARAQAAVRAALKDPESARFSGAETSPRPGGVVLVCGWINAKNAFGGYTGRKPFVAMDSKPDRQAIVLMVAGSDTEVAAALEVCRADGLLKRPPA